MPYYLIKTTKGYNLVTPKPYHGSARRLHIVASSYLQDKHTKGLAINTTYGPIELKPYDHPSELEIYAKSTIPTPTILNNSKPHTINNNVIINL